MAVPGNAHTEPPQQPAAAFKRLLPPGKQADARAIADALDFQGRARADAGRPYVILNMASTVDGRASIGGGSAALAAAARPHAVPPRRVDRAFDPDPPRAARPARLRARPARRPTRPPGGAGRAERALCRAHAA